MRGAFKYGSAKYLTWNLSNPVASQVYCSTFFRRRKKHAFGTRNMIWHSEFTEFFWEQRSILVRPNCMHRAFCICFWRHTPLTFVLQFKSRINQDFYFKKVTGNKKWLILPCKPWLDNFCSSSSQIKRSSAVKFGRVVGRKRCDARWDEFSSSWHELPSWL